MYQNIFYNILVYNIIDSNIKNINNNNNNYIKDIDKELQLCIKIINLYTKFKYYKYNLYKENGTIINIFNKSQKIYYIVKKFINNLKKINAKLYNNEDLFGNELNNINTFNIYIDKFIYKFTYYDLIKIIKNSLFNYKTDYNENNITNSFCSPLEIKNPYTNIVLNKNILYNFYLFCKNNKYKITTELDLYYKTNFNRINS